MSIKSQNNLNMNHLLDEQILEKAINDHNRLKHGLGVIFNTRKKHPAFKAWQKHSRGKQKKNEIKRLYNKNGIKNTSYSYFTGIGGLIDLDFDWEWTYHVLKRKYPEKFDTLTIKTPNGGYRCLYIVENPKDYLKFRDKPPKIEIHGEKGKHVIVYGRGEDDTGNLQKYSVVCDNEIKEDPKIIDFMINFLEEWMKTCSFLEYNCIKNSVSHKKNHCTHDQRTSIAGFFNAEKIPIEDAIDFFRTFTDFDYNITKDHLERVYEKRFKHPTCNHLKDVFGVDLETCKNCSRKLETNNEKTILKENKSNVFDLSQTDDSDIFSFEDDEEFTEIITEQPITIIDGSIYYLIPLKPQIPPESSDSPEEVKELIGFYGEKTGYGFDPISFYTNNDHARPNVIISESNNLLNENQQRMIELCIKETLSSNKNVKKTQQIVLSEINRDHINNSFTRSLYEKLKYYLKLDNDIQYIITTCFIIGTYLFPLFASFGYMIVSGEKGTGKGTFLDLMEKTCWNATSKQVSITEATLFRRISKELPTLIIDEYHRTISNGSSGNALISILEAGYDRGGSVPRTEKRKDKKGNDEFYVVDYPVYCPKVLATRRPVEADEKGIKIILTKLINDKIYSKRKKELSEDPFFSLVRKMLMQWTVLSQNDVLRAYNDIEPTNKLNGREFNVWLPILAVCKIAFPDKYNELLSFAEETISKSRSNTYEKENRVLRALFSLHANESLKDGNNKLKDPSYKVTNKEIHQKLVEIENEGMHHNAIKSAMENLKLAGWSGGGQYFIKKTRLLELFDERGLYDE